MSAHAGGPSGSTAALRSSLLVAASLAAVAVASVVSVPGTHGLFWPKLFDAAHLPAFALLAVVLHRAFAWSFRPTWALVLAAVASVGVAVAVELVQPAFGRLGTRHDLLQGCLGVAFAVVGIELWRRRARPLWHVLLGAGLVAALAVALRPALAEREAVVWRARNFPLLAGFEDPAELPLWSTREPGTTLAALPGESTSGRQALEVRVAAGRRAGVNLDAGGFDWSGYEALVFDVYNPGERFRLGVLGIDDSRRADLHGRFTGRYFIEPGWNTVRIPVEAMHNGPRDRKLNVTAMERVLLVIPPAPGGRAFRLDWFRLEGKRGSRERARRPGC